jgi:hypothetical protein
MPGPFFHPVRRLFAYAVLVVSMGPVLAGCSSSGSNQITPVAPAPPPRDDGKPAQGGQGGSAHAAALEELRIAPLRPRTDRQNSIRVPLPDAEHWTRVKFWGLPSLVGFRYGKDHHAIVAGYVTHVDDNTEPGACRKSFEDWAKPYADTFDVDVKFDPPKSTVWRGNVVDVVSVFAKTATLAARDAYAVAYATYPAWKGACLVVGVAVPARDEEARARIVRDRFLDEVLPNVQVVSTEEPKERY